MARHYVKLSLYYDKDKKEQSITLGELFEKFPDCVDFIVRVNGKFYTVEVDEYGYFFSFLKLVSAGVTLFAIHLGIMVFDPNEMD